MMQLRHFDALLDFGSYYSKKIISWFLQQGYNYDHV